MSATLAIVLLELLTHKAACSMQRPASHFLQHSGSKEHSQASVPLNEVDCHTQPSSGSHLVGDGELDAAGGGERG